MPPLSTPGSFLQGMLEGKIEKKNIPSALSTEFKYSVQTPKNFADREVVFKSEEYIKFRSILKHFSSMEDEINSPSDKTDGYLNHMKENKEEMINETNESIDFITVKFTSIQAHALYDFLMNLSSLFHSMDSKAKTKEIDDLAYLFHKAADQAYRY